MAIVGNGTVDGSRVDFHVYVQDLAKSGQGDTYRIQLRNGYDSGERPLDRADIKIK